MRIDWSKEPDLGRVPDTELAERYGCSPRNVGIARQGRGIPPYRPEGLEKAAALERRAESLLRAAAEIRRTAKRRINCDPCDGLCRCECGCGNVHVCGWCGGSEVTP